jgi:hypothetical protein
MRGLALVADAIRYSLLMHAASLVAMCLDFGILAG